MKTKVFVLFFSLVILTTLVGKQSLLTVDPQNEPFDPDSGGPDPYGYIWIDSNDPGGPIFNWKDTTNVWTKVYGLSDDNNVGPFPIGFDFPYYWYKVNQFWVNSNGCISFSDAEVYMPQSASGMVIPSTNPPNDLVIPLGADLTFQRDPDSGECYIYTNNVDTLIVSYLDVPTWVGPYDPEGSHTFQLILTREDSCIIFQYGRQYGGFSFKASAGIEDTVGNVGLMVFYLTMCGYGYTVKFIPPSTGVEEGKNKTDRSYSLSLLPVTPNPLRGNTLMHYSLPNESDVTLKVYNILGQEVRTLVDSHQKSGIHSVIFDVKDSRGNALPQGVYFYRLKVGNNSLTRKITLVR